ncbi:MAG: hypothetical protein GXO26_01760 [Crenarchaeota archaeon]|nr:hypothetical protein [Thermoproteota archaeon]
MKTRNITPNSLTTKRLIIKLIARTHIKAPFNSKPLIKYIVTKYNLTEKYGEKIVQHIDGVFLRQYCELHKKIEPTLLPSIKGALTGAARLGAKSSLLRVISACTAEDNISVYVRRVTTPQGQSTLVTVEVILPGSEIYCLCETEDEEVLRKLIELKGKTIIIGGWRNIGFGQAEIVEIRPITT